MSNSLQPRESQHARPPCPSPTHWVYSNSCPSSWWCHLAISSCCPLLLPPIPPSIRVFSNELTLHMRWPKYWKLQLQHQPQHQPHYFLANRWGNNRNETVSGGSKITADGDCSHEIKDASSLGKKSYDQLRQNIKKQRHYLTNGSPSSQSCGFSSSPVWIWELNYKESCAPKNWCVSAVVVKTLGLQDPTSPS